MSEEIKQTGDKVEVRKFKYANGESNVGFEFEIDVTEPHVALAEIADFIELLGVVVDDMKEMQKEFAKKIEKPKVEKSKPAVDASVEVVGEQAATVTAK